ncbi:MAG: TetR/AcrR family transcriptional regulator [Chloroflexota bacterium]
MSDLRRQVLEAAEALLLERGYRGLSMREIAEAVGVTKAALYYHFKDKEELLLAILDAYLVDMEARLAALADEALPARDKIQRLVAMILSQPAEKRALIRLSSQEMAQLGHPARQSFDRVYHTRFLDRIQAILQHGMQTGELRRVDPGMAAWALLGMLYPYFYPAHSQDLPAPADVAGQLAALFLDGLAL